MASEAQPPIKLDIEASGICAGVTAFEAAMEKAKSARATQDAPMPNFDNSMKAWAEAIERTETTS
jgi:hypothetical protein